MAVDTGGTFTDFVAYRRGRCSVLKLPSTPDDPARAVLEGLRLLCPGGELAGEPAGEPFVLAHGSTVATNALLERRGARVAFVTNAGFEDILEIGRQNRPQLYALVGTRPPPLVAREDRVGIAGRLGPGGEEDEPLGESELRELPERCRAAEAIAIGMLHSYANPEHELRVARALEGLGVPVTASAVLLPEFREYERFSTAAVNAYVAPLVQRYVATLRAGSGALRLRIMGSAGGSLSPERAAREPVHTMLSGPAGGVVAALEVARRTRGGFVLSFDMGGTSTDVSLCPRGFLHTRESEIGGAPIAIPVIDIHTAGAGGGSVAWRDPGGALRVGPRSAGAVPGPICYRRGGNEVTVTDAHVWIGRIPADAFLGGTAPVERDAIEGPLRALADSLGMSPDETAVAILEVANTLMEGALRVVSVERGYDPSTLTLVAFGGAAPLHACELAERLDVRRVVVPPDPGLLSARGILIADVRKDAARTLLRPLRPLRPPAALARRELEETYRHLEAAVRGELAEEAVPAADMILERWIDARYAGQGYELRVPGRRDWVARFHRAHRMRYGFARPSASVEAVTARVVGRARVERPTLPRLARADKRRPGGEPYLVCDGRRWVRTLRVDRRTLRAGHVLPGPAVITEYSATTWIPAGWSARVLPHGDLELAPQRRRRRVR
ncbi:MAG: hydantoinase/oxoprolinase family protein [Gemmatimonadetes bacterium]|nr:hydantoinase/oxoprolinase family protein [Gemmatimonadota bacterium]